ncbi:MAG: GyrI-like domain-containing protein [Campylobacterota bacterium]|nr:GyrI-like domain-containing protein [Campylobacterota bacterium]
MPNIKKVNITTKTIYGLQTRTKNSDEMNPATGKIAPLWNRLYSEILPTLAEGTPLYGVYSNYESDAFGAFDVLVGSEVCDETLDSVTLQEGRYLKFPVKGEMPAAIIDTWKQVWAYFEDPSIDERRAYETDFERYTSMDEAEIYIGVHYF